MILVVLATREADEIIAASRADLAASFPMRGQAAIHALLDGGPVAGRGLLAFDPFRDGRRALATFRVDRRKREFDHERAPDVVRTLEIRRRGVRRDG